jgi:UDP-N-acetylglucosamine transferase subunit ALG13
MEPWYAPLVLVTVGTDHHPFDRLIGWVNDWLGEHPAAAGAFFVQSGSARVEPACAGARFLDALALDQVLSAADMVICHGGPGSIADAWERGLVPITVPRQRRFGEVVDDHQVDFCDKLAGLGRIRLATDHGTFAALIDEATADPSGFRTTGPGPDAAAAVARFGELVDELVSRPQRRRARGHRPSRAGTPDDHVIGMSASIGRDGEQEQERT